MDRGAERGGQGMGRWVVAWSEGGKRQGSEEGSEDAVVLREVRGGGGLWRGWGEDGWRLGGSREMTGSGVGGVSGEY